MLRQARKVLSIIILIIILFIGLLTYDWLNFIRSPLIAQNGIAIDYILESGASIFTLAKDLKQLKILERPIYLVVLAKWCRLSQHLKAGEYRFMPGLKPLQLLQQIAQGRVLAHELKIVEGWTFEQMIKTIRAESALKQTLAGFPPEIIIAKLDSNNISPEGLFFPDTYRYTRGTTDLAILRVAFQTMNKRLLAEWQKRAAGLPYNTPYEALIVASLVEKESGLKSERAIIAGIIINRLNKNMLLQIDPTIIYGIGNNYRGKIYNVDLKKDTPYNTYLHTGLPPTPIALPGLASIHAALHPHASNYLYFVATGNGSHYFSATLKEHTQAIQRYRQSQRSANQKLSAISKIITDLLPA